MKRIRHSILLLAMLLLQGCVNVATTSAQAIYNRHNLQKNFSEHYTNYKIYQALYFKNDDFKDSNISISTYNDEILLAGQVPTSWQRAKAEQIVKKISQDKVHNLITIGSPSSALTRISDTWITTKIKTKLMASNDLDATKIKVVTENGTVYLMGTLLADEAKFATEVASETEGVQRVIRIFSYMKITKHPM